MSVSPQTLAINPSLGNGIGSLLLGEAKQFRDNSSRGDLDEHNVIETDLVVGVQECQTSLDLVCLDHGLQDFLNSHDLSISEVSTSTVCSRDPVCDGQNSTQVIRWVTPLSGQPAVIVIEPSDHSTDVESSIDRIKLERGSRDLGAVWNDGSIHNRAQQLCAFLKSETFETTS